MEKQKIYSAKGVVYGSYWGGGTGCYGAKEYNNYFNLKKLEKDIKKDLEKGALDGGMGFENLLAAKMLITVEEKIVVKGKEYSCKEQINEIYENDTFLKERDYDFIDECFYEVI